MLVVATILLAVALGAAAYRRSAGVPTPRAAGEGVLFAAAVALVYWIAFVRHGPTPWWEEDRQRRAAAERVRTSAGPPAAVELGATTARRRA